MNKTIIYKILFLFQKITLLLMCLSLYIGTAHTETTDVEPIATWFPKKELIPSMFTINSDEYRATFSYNDYLDSKPELGKKLNHYGRELTMEQFADALQKALKFLKSEGLDTPVTSVYFDLDKIPELKEKMLVHMKPVIQGLSGVARHKNSELTAALYKFLTSELQQPIYSAIKFYCNDCSVTASSRPVAIKTDYLKKPWNDLLADPELGFKFVKPSIPVIIRITHPRDN